MTIADRLKQYLEKERVAYETVPHPKTATASENAEAAHVPGDSVAKAVVMHHEDGYTVAVVPSDCRVDLSAMQNILDRRLGLASEREIETVFDDCEGGAAPPIGAAYGVPTVIDKSLDGKDRVWFEGGDHRTLVQVSGADFDRLMRDARHESFCEHA